ncbi:MAG: hypothetical protein VB092_07840, partial [Oscillospiraceae bacterium]|nr:hypothetical protein [Oscillospiraceae bacterium]
PSADVSFVCLHIYSAALPRMTESVLPAPYTGGESEKTPKNRPNRRAESRMRGKGPAATAE